MNENLPAPAMPDDTAMHKRPITLEDGRYMLFYTFGDEETVDGSPATTVEEPRPTPRAEEERDV